MPAMPVSLAPGSLMSPDTDMFFNPPSTPLVSKGPTIQPSLLRKESRPVISSLHIDQSNNNWTPGINLEQNATPVLDSTTSIPLPVPNPPTVNNHHEKPVNSPCFVHSCLERGALTGWSRKKHHQGIAGGLDLGVAEALQNGNHLPETKHIFGMVPSPSATTDEDGDVGPSLTKQLAETAVCVREMARQLGRTRVRSNIRSVLIVTKARDNRLIKLTRQIALYLMLKPRAGHERGLVVYVDSQLRHSRRFDADGIERDHPELFVPFPRRQASSSNSISSLASVSRSREDVHRREEGQLRYWTSDMCRHSPHLFDFVVTLGGDGTVLFTSSLFQRVVPPVLPFASGSLGFLTNFDFADLESVMDSAIDSGIRVNLRMRFTCTVYRAVANDSGKCQKAVKKGETGEIMMKNVEKGGWEALEGGWSGEFNSSETPGKAKDKEVMCFTTRPVETFEVLNDLVVDRGQSSYVSLLELFGDEHHLTTVQADGLTVSTPTGSTAYSLSAGGSLVHPEITALLITPICPHTLSFRPMLLPDSMELRICVPLNSRSSAWASFDGRGRVELKQGDHIRISASKYPFPTVCADKQSTDWFQAISRTLKWNERERQKSFVFVEEGPMKPKKRSKRGTAPFEQQHKTGTSTPEILEGREDQEEDEVSEEEEAETFDIDDSSPEAALKAAMVGNIQTAQDEALGREKVIEVVETDRLHRITAEAVVTLGNSRSKSKSRSKSRTRSGINTPGRYAGPQSHPPIISPLHAEFAALPSPSGSASSHDMMTTTMDQIGTRDDICSQKATSNGRSRITMDRDLDMDNPQTPTATNMMYSRNRSHHRSHSTDSHGHRAFAVWGQDESDSNPSDSDA